MKMSLTGSSQQKTNSYRVNYGKDGRVDLGLATDWYSVFLILDPIWRFVVVIVY